MDYLGTPTFPMGWGDPADDPKKTLYRERIAREVLSATAPERCVAKAAPAEEADVEKELRKLFEFDGGWLFTVAEKIVYGQDLVPGPQNIGNCVGFSHCMLLAAKVAHELLMEGDLEAVLGEYGKNTPVPYIPYSYGVGRCEYSSSGGFGRAKLSGDGSLCEWQIAGSMAHGFLPSDLDGLPGPLPQGTESVGRGWGSNSGDVLDQWRDKAIVYDLEQSEWVKDAERALEVVTKVKQPLQICSNWGFERSSWDSKYEIEVSVQSGSWAHSMQVVGMIKIKDAWFVIIRNQWGTTYHKKVGHGVPAGCFAVTFDTFARWIKQSETASIGELKGRQLNVPFPV